MEKLIGQIRVEDAEKPKTDTKVAGLTVVFTGSLERMTRDEAKPAPKALARRSRARYPRRPISWSLVPGAGSKLEAARALGVTVLTEDEWLAMIG